jgi:Carbohydrate family 9 binding domain-like
METLFMFKKPLLYSLTVLTLFCLTNPLAGAGNIKPLLAIGKVWTAPVIDGKLNDSCWQDCIEAGNFTKYPKSAKPVSEATWSIAAYDKTNLYIAFKCRQEILNPKFNMLNSFKAISNNRDDSKIFHDESVEIFLSPDKTDKYFQICVNSNGAVYDALGMSKAWNAPIKAKGVRGNGFWTIEIAIPLKSLTEHPIIPGQSVWKINFCRNNRAQKESCSWSPALRGFHAPESFGELKFEDSVPGISKIQISGLDSQKGALDAIIRNGTTKTISVKAKMTVSAKQVKKTSLAYEVASGKSREINLSYSLPPQKKEFFLKYSFKSKKDKTTTIGVSNKFYLKPNTKYIFKAKVKSNLTRNGKSKKYDIFYIQNKETKKYLWLKGAAIPLQTSEWTEVRTEWTSPKVSGGTIWIIKWAGRGLKGDIQIDDIFLGESDSGKNLIGNGDFSKGRQNWSTLLNLQIQDNTVEKFGVTYSFFANGKTCYRSSERSVVVSKIDPLINSKFVNFSIVDVSSDGLSLQDELYICVDSAERVNLIVSSSKADSVSKCFVELLVPMFCKLVNPAGRSSCLLPRKINEKIIKHEGKAYRQYHLELGAEAISRSGAPYWQKISIPLVFESTGANNVSGYIKYRASLNDKEKEQRYHSMKVVSLPPLLGFRPKQLPFILWAYPTSFELKELSNHEQKKIITKIGQAGYNLAHIFYEQKADFKKAGIEAFAQLPTISISGNFPEVKSFLRQNPQYSAVYDTGNKATTVSPHLLAKKDFPFIKKMEKVFAAYAKHYPQNLLWDYEHGFLPNNRLRARIGFSKENLELFRKKKKIPKSVKLDAKMIYSKYREQWIDFRCHQNAQAAALYSRLIKASAPGCRFSFYSAYPPGSRKNYGVDWKYVSPYIDFAVSGYGGSSNKMLNVLTQKYFVPGLLGLRPIDQDVLEPVLLDYLFSSGSFMGFIGFVVDGRFFYKSSKAGAIATDFEKFFLNLKSCRRDNLVSNTTGVQALEYQGERIVLVKNSSAGTKAISFKNLNLSKGFVAIDHDTKKVYHNPQTLTVNVKAEQTALIYLCPVEKLNSKPVQPHIFESSTSPILRWKSDNGVLSKYTIEYSNNKMFKNATKKVNINKPFFQFTKLLLPGKYYWRVRAENLNDSARSPWSKTGIVNFAKDKLLSFRQPSNYRQDPISKLGFWRAYRWGGGAPFGKSCKDYEVKHGGKYSLYTLNHFDTAFTVWGNGATAGSGTKFIQVKPGDFYKFSAWIKTSGLGAGSSLRLEYLDSTMKVVRSFQSKLQKSNDKWSLLSIAAKAPAKTVSLRFSCITRGKGESWCSDMALEKVTK